MIWLPSELYTRHRENWVRHAGTHIQHMQKALRLMNLNLVSVRLLILPALPV